MVLPVYAHNEAFVVSRNGDGKAKSDYCVPPTHVARLVISRSKQCASYNFAWQGYSYVCYK